LLAALLSACDGSSDGNAEQLIERAGQHLASGDRNAAVIELKNAIQRDPDSAPARMMLAQIYLDGGDGTSAEAELVKAQAAGAKGTNLELLLVRSRLVSGAYQAVIDQVPADLLLDDTGSRALYEARGEALMALQRLDEAVAVFERVLAKENMARAHGGLARIAISRGEFDEAEPHLKEALALEPDRSEWYALEGESLLAQSRYQDAKAAFEHFVDKDKGYITGQLGYVRALTGVGDLEKAQAWITDLQQRAPDDSRVVLLSSIVDLERGEFASAKTAAERVLAVDEANERALYVAGIAAYQIGEFELANKRLTQYAANAKEKNVRAILYLGATKLRLGDAKGALALLKSDPTLMQQSSAAMDLLAQAALQSGDTETALTYLEQLAERRPDDAQTQARLGFVRVAAGDEDAGIDALEKAVEQDPTLDAVAQRLVLEQLRAGKLDEALASAQKLTEKNPNRANGYILQGMVWLQKSGLEAAEPFFRKAWEAEPGNPSAGLNVAQIDVGKGNIASAIDILNKVLEKTPGHLQTLLFLADLEGRSGNLDRQEKLLRDAVDANADSAQARVLLARLLLQQKRASEALTTLSPVIKPDLPANTVNGALLETAAIAAIMQNEPSQALGYLKQLQQQQPKSVQAQFLAAQAHNALGQLAEAETDLRRALDINSDHYDSRKMLAAVLQGEGRYSESLDEVAIAKKQRPTDPNLADLEVRAHLAASRFPEAIAAAQHALELAPRTERVVALAQAYWTAGQKKEATASLEDWLKAKPDDTGAHMALASMLFQSGDTDLAIQHYDTAAKLQPKNAIVANDFAFALWKSGNKERARTEAERAFDLAPNSPQVQDTLGVILVDNGAEDRGLQLLQAASTAMPNEPAIQYHLALAYQRAGDTERARTLLKGILDNHKTFAERADAQKLLDSIGQ
jgi:putative PEP-CTERM system TPR-repeat lipoprotein